MNNPNELYDQMKSEEESLISSANSSNEEIEMQETADSSEQEIETQETANSSRRSDKQPPIRVTGSNSHSAQYNPLATEVAGVGAGPGGNNSSDGNNRAYSTYYNSLNIPQGLSKRNLCLITCCMLTGPAVIIAAVYGVTGFGQFNVPEDNNPSTPPDLPGFPIINFSYRLMSDEQGRIALHNSGNGAATIHQIAFSMNANISRIYIENLLPNGTVINNTSSLAAVFNQTTLTYRYLLNLFSPATINPNTTEYLFYNFTNVAGPINLPMPPREMAISFNADNNGVFTPVYVVGYSRQFTPLFNQTLAVSVINTFARHVNYSADELPSWLTHINYGPFGIHQNGSVYLTQNNFDGNFIPQLALLRQQYPHLNTVMIVDGNFNNVNFAGLIQNPAIANQFTIAVTQTMQELQFNGIHLELPWGAPYLTNNDAAGLTYLFQELRNNLPTSYQMSFNLPVNPTDINRFSAQTWRTLQQLTDTQVLMANEHNRATPITNYPSPLFADPRVENDNPSSIVNSLNRYGNLGLGLNIYTIRLRLASEAFVMPVQQMGNTNGLLQPKRIPDHYPGQFNDRLNVYERQCLITRQCHNGQQLPADTQLIGTVNNTYPQYTASPLGFSRANNLVVFYEDLRSIQMKTAFIKNWELNGLELNNAASGTRGSRSEIKDHICNFDTLASSAYLTFRNNDFPSFCTNSYSAASAEFSMKMISDQTNSFNVSSSAYVSSTADTLNYAVGSGMLVLLTGYAAKKVYEWFAGESASANKDIGQGDLSIETVEAVEEENNAVSGERENSEEENSIEDKKARSFLLNTLMGEGYSENVDQNAASFLYQGKVTDDLNNKENENLIHANGEEKIYSVFSKNIKKAAAYMSSSVYEQVYSTARNLSTRFGLFTTSTRVDELNEIIVNETPKAEMK